MTEADASEPVAEMSAAPAERSDRVMWGLVAGVSLISTALGAYEIAPASVTPLIRESMGIGATAAGLLVGVMFGVAVVTSLPAGALLDRTDTRVTMALSVVAIFPSAPGAGGPARSATTPRCWPRGSSGAPRSSSSGTRASTS